MMNCSVEKMASFEISLLLQKFFSGTNKSLLACIPESVFIFV